MIIIQGNGIVKTISISKKLGVETRSFQILVCYDLLEGLTDEEEDLIFEIEPKLLSIGTITILDEIVSLLSIGMSKAIINGKSNLKQGTSNQGVIEVVLSTTNTIKCHVRLEISLEDKVYPKIYYHRNQVDIEVDETPAKIQV